VIRRFFRTPKGLLIIVLAILTGLAMADAGPGLVGPGLASGIGVAAILDAIVLRLRGRAWEFPSGAILSGWLVAMVLSPYEAWYVPACTSAVAVVSKYAFRMGPANVFNPAALAIVVTFYALGTGQNWWGALPDLRVVGLVALFVTGVFITDRVNKLPLVLAFLFVYCLLFTITAFVGDPRRVAEIFRSPDVNAALFFAFFILTDPPTSPVKYRDQIACGVLVAAVGYGVFQIIGAAHYLLSGVLAGNVWEMWRRRRLRTTRARAK
jgi:Na+-translocating ferredoxin:NAD+ oxidoreductase RnfD subunit